MGASRKPKPLWLMHVLLGNCQAFEESSQELIGDLREGSECFKTLASVRPIWIARLDQTRNAPIALHGGCLPSPKQTDIQQYCDFDELAS